MTKQEIYEFMSKHPVFYLATVEGDQPRVRGMLLYKADKDGIIFHTASSKDVYKQIKDNPKVELCFNGEGLQLRATGQLEEVKDEALKEEIYNHPTRKFLQDWKKEGILDDQFVIYKLIGAEVTTWTMQQNFAPKTSIKL